MNVYLTFTITHPLLRNKRVYILYGDVIKEADGTFFVVNKIQPRNFDYFDYFEMVRTD